LLDDLHLSFNDNRGKQTDAVACGSEGPLALLLGVVQHHQKERQERRETDEKEPRPQSYQAQQS
jgi:hypothetical protein